MNIEQPETASVLAAYSIHSLLNRSQSSPPLRSHVLRADGQPACGLVWCMSAPYPADEANKSTRCQRPGCKERWPAPVYE